MADSAGATGSIQPGSRQGRSLADVRLFNETDPYLYVAGRAFVAELCWVFQALEAAGGFPRALWAGLPGRSPTLPTPSLLPLPHFQPEAATQTITGL